jgi:pSer/pThr/pTyr-binding forkhead associated (FHA) protein
VTIARDGAQGVSYPLDADQLDLGREEGQIVLPGDGYLSPRHLRLSRRADKWFARDLGSTNGVYLRLRRPHRLIDGDLLLLGLEVIRFELVKESEQGLGPAMQHGTLVFGSPLLPRRARLCQRTVEGVTRNVYYLTREETIVGRESGDLVFSDDLFMSRRHLSVRRDPANGDFVAEDLGASNGTFVAVRDEVPVTDGDFIRVGQHLFRLDLNAERP